MGRMWDKLNRLTSHLFQRWFFVVIGIVSVLYICVMLVSILVVSRETEGSDADLGSRVRILCWVLTTAKRRGRALAVKQTWGSRCDKLIFISSENNSELGSVHIENVTEGYDYLWGKTREALRYVYYQHYAHFDWFYKADDDTYAIMENLRYFLKDYDPDRASYFGLRFNWPQGRNYTDGGAGYALSKKALRLFVEVGLKNTTEEVNCGKGPRGAEDVELSKCLAYLNVTPEETRDELGRDRFFHFTPEHHIIPGNIGPDSWYYQRLRFPEKNGVECCSDTAISFHYVSPEKMLVFDYMLYHLRPHGILPGKESERVLELT